MSSIQPDLGSSLYVWCRNSGPVGALILYGLTSSHLYPEVLMNLLHYGLNLIGIQASVISFIRWFPCERHPRILPCTTKKGVHLVVSDIPLFAANSARGSHCTQSSCWWLTKTRRYCSRLAFIRSIWQSVWGWNPVDSRWSIPKWLQLWPQKVEANCGPRSETIVAGIPWRHTTSHKNNLAISTASIVVWQGIKWRIFESLSTTTQIASNP